MRRLGCGVMQEIIGKKEGTMKYTNREWINMLKEVDEISWSYEEIQKQYGRYNELEEKKNAISENTGLLFKVIFLGVVIFGFIKFGWLKGFVIFIIVGIVDDLLEKLIVKKKLQKKLERFDEEFGEEMIAFEEMQKALENQLRKIEANESLQICKKYLPANYMGGGWYDEDARIKRGYLKYALDDSKNQTLEEAIEADYRAHC